jgi:NAD(P)-dependent dehydrogenase (short-subunit alcohol dehydrogenase family)
MNDSIALPEAFSPGNVAVVSGAASGIGLAAARRFAGMGMKVAVVDLGGEKLDAAVEAIASQAAKGKDQVLKVATDVSDRTAVLNLQAAVTQKLGPVSVLMNNAGSGGNPGLPWENAAGWKQLLDVNLWGIIHGVEAFVPGMVAGKAPAVVINTGSKQGITSPPGNSAYNMSKAAVKSFTESLAHQLLKHGGKRISAHLLIPGFTFTGMTGGSEKPAAAWTAGQVVEFMLKGVAAGDFYILCPDNAVDRATDEKRMRWTMDDIILNRPALSRWHPDFEAQFATYMKNG